MGRIRTYDPDEALDAARRVFWRKGFAETSYDDLTRETGVSRKGLYTSFGDKHALFLKALERYRTTIGIGFLTELDQPEPTRETIVAMFRRIGEMSKTEFGRMGCFMANTAADETVRDSDVGAQVHAHLEAMRKRFAFALEAADVPAERVTSLADYLVGVLQGLLLLAHAGAAPTLIDNFVAEGMRAVEA